MTYTLTDNGEVVLQMSQDDYARMLCYITMAAGTNKVRAVMEVVEFLNALNATNPNWNPL